MPVYPRVERVECPDAEVVRVEAQLPGHVDEEVSVGQGEAHLGHHVDQRGPLHQDDLTPVHLGDLHAQDGQTGRRRRTFTDSHDSIFKASLRGKNNKRQQQEQSIHRPLRTYYFSMLSSSGVPFGLFLKTELLKSMWFIYFIIKTFLAKALKMVVLLFRFW